MEGIVNDRLASQHKRTAAAVHTAPPRVGAVQNVTEDFDWAEVEELNL